MTRKLRSVGEIEEACELNMAQLDKAAKELLLSDIDPLPHRHRAEVVSAVLGALSWMIFADSEIASVFAQSLKRLRELHPEAASRPSVQPAPMTFSEAVAEFAKLCDENGHANDEIGFDARWERHDTGSEYVTHRAYVPSVFDVASESLSNLLSRVKLKLCWPAPQDVDAALEAVDVEALARAEDDGMAAAVEGVVPTPEQVDAAEDARILRTEEAEREAASAESGSVFDSAEEDAAQAE